MSDQSAFDFDAIPDVPAGFWDDTPPEPPDDWMPPDLADDEPPPIEPDGETFVTAAYARDDVPNGSRSDFEPATTWERYLASESPDKNPDVAEEAMRDRAAGLGLIDARFIGVEYQNPEGQPTGYAVGCMEVYDVGGRYLEVARFEDPLEAADCYQSLQQPVEKGEIGIHAVHEFGEFAAREQGIAPAWQDADLDLMEVYDFYAERELGHEVDLSKDAPQSTQPAPDRETSAAFNALSAIGVQAEDFDPAQDPPPYYDPATGTAYWIGIFQPDLNDPEHCVASVLTLGRNPESGDLEAQLAPCVPGDWDKAYESGQHLLNVMDKQGLDACMVAAESMAVATDQRELWDTERGIALDDGYARQTAQYTRETWELDI